MRHEMFLLLTMAALMVGSASSTGDGAANPTTMTSAMPDPDVCTCLAPGVATYTMSLEFLWPSPQPPSSAHWSPAIGTSHSTCYSMFRSGELATPGIQQMAETGARGLVIGEFTSAGANTLSQIDGAFINSATGTTTDSFTVDHFHSLVSLTSMIAPSPDWFVGVRNLNLCKGTEWLPTVSAVANPYDAGTDSGMTYSAGNSRTDPPQNIERFTSRTTRSTNFQSYNGQPMARVTFTRTSIDKSSNGTAIPGCDLCGSTVMVSTGSSGNQSGQTGKGSGASDKRPAAIASAAGTVLAVALLLAM